MKDHLRKHLGRRTSENKYNVNIYLIEKYQIINFILMDKTLFGGFAVELDTDKLKEELKK